MNRGIDILLHQTLREQDSVLVVVPLPGHKANQRILAQGNLAVVRGRAVGDHLAGFHMIPLIDDRLLVIAVRLVASLKFRKTVHVPVPVRIPLDHNLIRRRALDHAGILSQHAHAGVHGRLALDTGSDNGCLGGQERHGLTLHVGTHQRAVRIVIFQERNHGGRHRENHLRGNVHQINSLSLEFRRLLAETPGYIVMDKMAVLVQRLVRLRHHEIILFVGR